MPTILHPQRDVVYSVKRSGRRRTVTLRVDPSGAVTVLAPRFGLEIFIDRFVRRRVDWILAKLRYFEGLSKQYPPKHYVAGELFPVWGRALPLEIVRVDDLKTPRCEAVAGSLRVFLKIEGAGAESAGVQTALRAWYAGETAEKLKESLSRNAARLGVAPRKVKVVNQNSRWGSCSSKGNLRFNWRLSAMPEFILDYVVVHELAHLRAHNHSQRFWSIVALVLPDHKERRRWLRQNSRRFHIQ